MIHEYDAYERITKTYSAFKNQGPTTNASLCRVVERDYSSPSGSGDDATISTNSPRLVVEKLLGSEIRRTYSLYSTNQLKTIQCQTVGAAWDASDNLVTTTDVIATGMHAGFPSAVTYPDGTKRIYEFSTDTNDFSRIVTESFGEPNGGGTAIVDGTKTITTNAPLGEVLGVATFDIASGIKIAEEIHSNFDAFGRAGKVTGL